MANRDALEAALAGLNGVVRGQYSNSGPHHGQLCVVNSDCDSTPGNGSGVCKGRFISFAPALSASNRCTALADIKVPLRNNGLTEATTTLRLQATPSNDPITGKKRGADTDTLRLTCKPKP